MPWTFYRYILKDAVKFLLVATVVLLLVFSFAAAIKPLSDGLLDPLGLIRFVAYTVPTMLAVVLPFSGAFAVTMVFCRTVSDNEITVCLASGISYRLILGPVLLFGLVLTLSIFYLSNWVVPSFYQKVAIELERDLTQVLVHQIRRGQAVELPRGLRKQDWTTMLYATRAEVTDEMPWLTSRKVQPRRCIMVRDVVVGQFSPDGQLRGEVTAGAADVFLFREEGRTWIEMVLKDAMAYDPQQGLVRVPDIMQLGRMFVPSPFRDDPKFLSWPRLNRLARYPDRYDQVRDRKATLAHAMASQDLLSHLAASLQSERPGRVILSDSDERETYRISAPHVVRDDEDLRLTSDGDQSVQLHLSKAGEVHSLIEADFATIEISKKVTTRTLWGWEADRGPGRLEVKLRFENPLMSDLRQRAEPLRQPSFERRATWHQDLVTVLTERPVRELLVDANKSHAGVPSVDGAARKLRYTLDKLNRKIIAQINVRGAAAITAVLMVVVGLLLSLMMAGSLPLVVYFWTFLIAMVVVLITHSGENLMTNVDYPITSGLAITWLGDLLMAGLAAMLYWRVTRL